MNADELAKLLQVQGTREVVIRHDLSTSQKFRFDVLRVEADPQTNIAYLVTNGVVREDLK